MTPPGHNYSTVQEWLPALGTAPGTPWWPGAQLLRVRDHPGARELYDWLHDELWLATILRQQRKAVRLAERAAYDERAGRILEAMRDSRPMIPGLWP